MIADAVMATAIEGVIDKAGEAKAWVVEKAEARAAAKAAAKAGLSRRSGGRWLRPLGPCARTAGYCPIKDEVRELIRHINEQHSQLVHPGSVTITGPGRLCWSGIGRADH